MGAKAPVPQKLRRPTVQCYICGRKFLSAQALKSHHSCMHAGAGSPNSTKKAPENKLEIKKKLVPVNMSNMMDTSAASKSDDTDVKEKSEDLAGNETEIPSQTANLTSKQPNLLNKQAKIPVKTANNQGKQINILARSASPKIVRKPEFECPVCENRFSIYLSAFRHIQHNHCVNSKGEKVTPTSPHLIKPVRVEECSTCNIEIRSTERHNCPKRLMTKDQYFCLGCKQTFSGLTLFQQHVKGLHSEESEVYYFPTREEFIAWKRDLESQTSLEYVRLNVQPSKEVYHCSHQPAKTVLETHLCPSSIVVRDYTQGVHVFFYMKHCGHSPTEIQLDQYEKYSISSYFRDRDDMKDIKVVAEEDVELYNQLKKILTCILSDSVSIHTDTLKKIVEKALEMTKLIKNNGKDDDISNSNSNKSLTDAQIMESLENPISSAMTAKRKITLGPKSRKIELKKVRKSSLSADEDTDVTTIITRSSPSLNKTVTFDDTVKEMDTNDTKTLEKSPTSFNDSYKDFVDLNFKSTPNTNTRVKIGPKKKLIVKTKIGQFKSKMVSPKKQVKTPPKTEENDDSDEYYYSLPTPWRKPDLEYEVKEQENDCNILILKI